MPGLVIKPESPNIWLGRDPEMRASCQGHLGAPIQLGSIHRKGLLDILEQWLPNLAAQGITREILRIPGPGWTPDRLSQNI